MSSYSLKGVLFLFHVLISIYVSGQETMSSRARAGITDTLSSNYPFITDNKGIISFPTGFRWNRTGPTGGFWIENQVDDNVFRPVFKNVEEFSLWIYNRKGSLVFATSDIYKGWDGYLLTGDLAAQGVYIWRAVGTFSDGKKFEKTGDVTFIY